MELIPRARRFPIATRVLWRPQSQRDQSDWSEGMSLNMSRSGVLFRCTRLPATGTQVDLILALSWEACLIDCADLKCCGRIVRIEERVAGDPAVATTIEGYSFLK